MTSRTFNITRSKDPSRVTKILDAIDVAAKYFVYKLYDATRGQPTVWAAVKGMDESRKTMARAVELGWVVLEEVRGKPLDPKAVLTDEGRRLARRVRQTR
jgi:hypothetical protein